MKWIQIFTANHETWVENSVDLTLECIVFFGWDHSASQGGEAIFQKQKDQKQFSKTQFSKSRKTKKQLSKSKRPMQ